MRDLPCLIEPSCPEAAYVNDHGALWGDDCMAIMPCFKDAICDVVFADPPFNLGKKYGHRSNDRRPELEYIAWCQAWLAQCIRILKPGGSLFLYNLPKWNIPLGAFLLDRGLDFHHWIAVEINSCLPIQGRLYPAHYSLLYYSKGRRKTFHKIRTPIQTCRHCHGEIKDYGGHRKKMNRNGVNLKDVWTDIPPVRHGKFQVASRKANALSTKLLSRVVEMSSDPGDLIFDPFGGSGTTYEVCQRRGRRWLGTEIDFAPQIIERLEGQTVQSHETQDFVEQ